MSRNKFPPKPRYDPDTGPVYLYGLHTVRAALDNPRREKRNLLVTPNALMRLKETGPVDMRFTETTPKELDRLLIAGGARISPATASKLSAVANHPGTWANAPYRPAGDYRWHPDGQTAADKRTARR